MNLRALRDTSEFHASGPDIRLPCCPTKTCERASGPVQRALPAGWKTLRAGAPVEPNGPGHSAEQARPHRRRLRACYPGPTRSLDNRAPSPQVWEVRTLQSMRETTSTELDPSNTPNRDL